MAQLTHPDYFRDIDNLDRSSIRYFDIHGSSTIETIGFAFNNKDPFMFIQFTGANKIYFYKEVSVFQSFISDALEQGSWGKAFAQCKNALDSGYFVSNGFFKKSIHYPGELDSLGEPREHQEFFDWFFYSKLVDKISKKINLIDFVVQAEEDALVF
jgi:hypothetical protein